VRKETCNLRHPMHLRHLAPTHTHMALKNTLIHIYTHTGTITPSNRHQPRASTHAKHTHTRNHTLKSAPATRTHTHKEHTHMQSHPQIDASHTHAHTQRTHTHAITPSNRRRPDEQQMKTLLRRWLRGGGEACVPWGC